MIISAWVFSRWMALIYLAAFWSLSVQILGLIGSHGILPAADFLHFITQQEGRLVVFGRLLHFAGLITATHSYYFYAGEEWSFLILFLIGIAPAFIALLMWLFYLSLTVVGQDFLGFQWDNLLLEAGLLLIFLVPIFFRTQIKPSVRPSIVIIWLFSLGYYSVLMFESGMVKLLSGDIHWSHFTALTYHYWTQPLPNIISWYANQLPVWFQKLSCALLFGIEIFIPFFIFGGRWGRLIAFFGITGLQVLIMLTGNYCFFNLLAMGLCLTLLEDEHLAFLGAIISPPLVGMVRERGIFYKILTGLVAAFILIISLALLVQFFGRFSLPKPIEKLMVAVSPMRSVNNYGLFAVMTTERDEIILEGSNDGEHWLPYEFRYKPGDVNEAPRWMAPHQPRLDWQMWFAALSTWRDNQWLMALMVRLLQGEPSVIGHLLATSNPFNGHPPRYIQSYFFGNIILRILRRRAL